MKRQKFMSKKNYKLMSNFLCPGTVSFWNNNKILYFFRPCSDVCCPQNYILPIPLPNLNKTDTAKEDNDSSMNASYNSDDSDSDENE